LESTKHNPINSQPGQIAASRKGFVPERSQPVDSAGWDPDGRAGPKSTPYEPMCNPASENLISRAIHSPATFHAQHTVNCNLQPRLRRCPRSASISRPIHVNSNLQLTASHPFGGAGSHFTSDTHEQHGNLFLVAFRMPRPYGRLLGERLVSGTALSASG
jgi:hypothetical protein